MSKMLELSQSTQRNDYSCGLRTIYSIAQYFDYVSYYSEIIQYAKDLEIDFKLGINEWELRDLIKYIGLKVLTRKNLNIKKIKNSINKERPVICSIRNGTHWIAGNN